VARALSAGILALCLLAGCSDRRPYEGAGYKNLQVRTASTSGTVALDVYSLDAKCNATYEGFVILDRPVVEVGLPAARPSLLVFEFHNPNVTNKKELQVVPRVTYRYEVRVALKGSIYDIELREIDPRTGADREIDTSRRC
jgi:hypothetical protein